MSMIAGVITIAGIIVTGETSVIVAGIIMTGLRTVMMAEGTADRGRQGMDGVKESRLASLGSSYDDL